MIYFFINESKAVVGPLGNPISGASAYGGPATFFAY